MTTIADMSLEELRKLIDEIVEQPVPFLGIAKASAGTTYPGFVGVAFKMTRSQTIIIDQCNSVGFKYQLAIYDSIYVALAKNFNVPLITVDQPQIRAAAAEGI